MGVAHHQIVLHRAEDLWHVEGQRRALEDEHVAEAGPRCLSLDVGGLPLGDLGWRIVGAVGQLRLVEQVIQGTGEVEILYLVTAPALIQKKSTKSETFFILRMLKWCWITM